MIGKVFIISSPSGGGKTTISKDVVDYFKGFVSIKVVVTYTSRPKRKHEIHGKDYFFLSKDEFLKKKRDGFFLETTIYNNEFYGSSKKIIEDLKKGESFIIIIDIEGAKNYSKYLDNVVSIWIIPPNIDVLRQRLMNRGTETAKQIEVRVELAKKEITWENNNRSFKYHVMNKNINDAVAEICSIVQKELF